MEQYLPVMLGSSITILLAVLAWIGARVHSRLDAINETLLKIDGDLTDRISKHDVRISVIEAEMGFDRGKP